MLKHGVNGARHLGCNGSIGLAAQMGVVPILRDVSLEFIPEAIGPFENCGLATSV